MAGTPLPSFFLRNKNSQPTRHNQKCHTEKSTTEMSLKKIWGLKTATNQAESDVFRKKNYGGEKQQTNNGKQKCANLATWSETRCQVLSGTKRREMNGVKRKCRGNVSEKEPVP